MTNVNEDESSEFENRQNFDRCLNELMNTATSPNVIAVATVATEEKFFLQSFSSDNDENETLTYSFLNENDDDETNLTLTTLATTNASASIKAPSSSYTKNAHYAKTKSKHAKKQNNQYYSTL